MALTAQSSSTDSRVFATDLCSASGDHHQESLDPCRPAPLPAFGMPRGPRHGAAAPSYAFRDVDHHHQPECNVHNAATAPVAAHPTHANREVTLATRGPKTHVPRISLQICREGGHLRWVNEKAASASPSRRTFAKVEEL